MIQIIAESDKVMESGLGTIMCHSLDNDRLTYKRINTETMSGIKMHINAKGTGYDATNVEDTGSDRIDAIEPTTNQIKSVHEDKTNSGLTNPNWIITGGAERSKRVITDNWRKAKSSCI